MGFGVRGLASPHPIMGATPLAASWQAEQSLWLVRFGPRLWTSLQPCRVPAVFLRQIAPASSCAGETFPHSANCAQRGDSTVQFFGVVLDMPVVVRVGKVQKTVKIPQLQGFCLSSSCKVGHTNIFLLITVVTFLHYPLLCRDSHKYMPTPCALCYHSMFRSSIISSSRC